MSVADGASPEPGPDATKGDIEADIEKTRADLGATTSALAAKLDVPQRVSEMTEPVRSNAVPIAVALGSLAAGVLIWRRRRH